MFKGLYSVKAVVLFGSTQQRVEEKVVADSVEQVALVLINHLNQMYPKSGYRFTVASIIAYEVSFIDYVAVGA